MSITGKAVLTRQVLLDAMDKIRNQKPTAHGLQLEDPHLVHPQGNVCIVCGVVVEQA